jgi:lysosomal acid lipase/cholesteryl ester hydrolase
MSPTVSIKQLIHYIQLYKSGKFQRFDYESHNHYHYGISVPPEYELKNVTVPTYLYHAEEDLLVVKKV